MWSNCPKRRSRSAGSVTEGSSTVAASLLAVGVACSRGQNPAGFQDPPQLPHGQAIVRNVLQYMVAQHQVEGTIRELEIRNIGALHVRDGPVPIRRQVRGNVSDAGRVKQMCVECEFRRDVQHARSGFRQTGLLQDRERQATALIGETDRTVVVLDKLAPDHSEASEVNLKIE